eukprot:9248099-Alexandrium_andersonii.AAC.1
MSETRQAKKRKHDGDPPAVDRAVEEPPTEELKRRHRNAAWCITCRCIKLAGPTHRSTAKGHATRECTEAELR